MLLTYGDELLLVVLYCKGSAIRRKKQIPKELHL